MDERLRFVARLLDGEQMSALCKEFGISRPTGYKIYNRYKELGPKGLEDRSRRPYRHANKLPFQIERAILAIKREYPSWGAPKDPREANQAISHGEPTGQEHGARHSRSQWFGNASEAPAP